MSQSLFRVEMSHQPERALTQTVVLAAFIIYQLSRNESLAREGIDTYLSQLEINISRNRRNEPSAREGIKFMII